MLFHDVRLPKFMEIFATGGPEFQTSHVNTISGREVRQLDREESLQKYSLVNCLLSNSQFQEFNSFFRARKGSYYSFRFRDSADYQTQKQILATGDNNDTRVRIPFFKTYNDPISPYSRRIYKPIKGAVKLYLNNIELSAEVDYESGMVLLPRSLKKGEILLAEFTFDVMVRFGSDNFNYHLRDDGAVEISKIELVEVTE
jgi:uncharacterized protein (TIGR02217 family)